MCAGHVPMVWAPAGKPAVLLESARRPLLGFHGPDEETRSAELEFATDDTVVMYTDGLIERRGETIDDGMHRLLEAVEKARDLPPQAVCDWLLEKLTSGEDPEDDIALLVVRRCDPRRPGVSGRSAQGSRRP
jgi:serine phosphatase RsbU (regulator of sigma subunit)